MSGTLHKAWEAACRLGDDNILLPPPGSRLRYDEFNLEVVSRGVGQIVQGRPFILVEPIGVEIDPPAFLLDHAVAELLSVPGDAPPMEQWLLLGASFASFEDLIEHPFEIVEEGPRVVPTLVEDLDGMRRIFGEVKGWFDEDGNGNE